MYCFTFFFFFKRIWFNVFFFFFQAEDAIRDYKVTGVQTCALPISTAVVAFILTGVFAILFGNAVDETMVLAVGFCMIFFTQLSGNSSQIFISEVFPTNARATGFGLAQAAGRAGAAIAILAIPVIQNVWSSGAVFVAIAVIVAIAAIAVTQVGPEAKGLALDEVAPPTA